MKKIFISIFLISFVFNFANAEEVKKNKTDEELIREIQELVKQENESNKRVEIAKNKTEEAKKMGKTLDELNKQLEKDKK